jgi:hypothetical protein
VRLIGVGGEVEVGEEQVPGLEQRDLLRLRLFDLYDHVGGREGLGGAAGDAGAGLDIVLVGEIDTVPGGGFTITSWPAATSSDTEDGVRPTRYSWFLISFGTPTRIFQAPVSRRLSGAITSAI